MHWIGAENGGKEMMDVKMWGKYLREQECTLSDIVGKLHYLIEGCLEKNVSPLRKAEGRKEQHARQKIIEYRNFFDNV